MPTMTIFEPLFLLCVLATIVVLASALVAALRGRSAHAKSKLGTLGICAGVYLALVLVVSAASSRKVYRVGVPQCFDDWCITVARATRDGAGHVNVDLTLTSRARRVPQAEKGTVVYLSDAQGRRFDPEPMAGTIPLDTRLQPGQSVDAPRRFTVPADARELGLVYTHEGGFPIGFFIIGENELFHGPPIVMLGDARP